MFELENEEKIKGKNYYTKEIPAYRARSLIKKHHYSHKNVPNSKLHLGIFDYKNKLVGVLSYGPPMNNVKTYKRLGCGDKMYELNRMVMDEQQPRNSESQAISICNKWLKKYTDIEFILSFSDGKEGNVGYIYQATNWKYIGYMLSDSFYDLDGEIMHNVTVWHRYKEKHKLRKTHTTHEILYTEFDNVSKITSKQHIYLFDIKRNQTRIWKNKEYPKLEKEVNILKREWFKRNGEVLNEIEYYTDEVFDPVL